MFDVFGFIKKNGKDSERSNVVKFPESKLVPAVPEVKTPKEPEPKVYYRLGVTDNNRVAFQMGYTEITMNKQGCKNLIDQIEFFMNQLEDDSEE